MNEFSTIYHYFKEFSKSEDNKNIIDLKSDDETQLPPTEECTNDSYPTAVHYLEMKSNSGDVVGGGSDSNNNEIVRESTPTKVKTISNLSYLNVDVSLDTVDSGKSFEMQVLKKRDENDLLNNLNDLRIKDEDEKEITNELTITEENYYDSQDQNEVKTTATTISTNDDFSHNCLDVLENVSQTETSSLSPSINSSSISDNQQQHSIDSDYLIQPSNRPVTIAHDFGDYLTQPSNRPIEEFTHDYMNAPKNFTNTFPTKREASHLRLYFKKKSVSSIDEDGPGYSKIHDFLQSPTKSIKSSTGTLKRTDSDASKKSVDDELLEIINDFKNKVFTIQEVEELVSAWKNRNDVRKSHTDKQEQLQKMREEYERIQQKIKENLKRPSPFERIKRIFSRKNSKENSNLITPVNLTGDPRFNRPESILSLASSNSSGRMSTSSSLGDSGTHSDHEERRNASRVFDNYLIPPAPRPISTPVSTPTEENKSVLSFSMSNHTTTPVDIEHYILFPSNVPIFPPPPPMSTFKGSS
jgi:phosphoinositide 3-kinase adapter protein 1